MPFYYDGACAEHLRALGFSDVIHEQEDFFQKVRIRLKKDHYEQPLPCVCPLARQLPTLLPQA